MAATLDELGPETFKEQFDAFGIAWGRLGKIALEDALHLAPEGAKRAMEGWPAAFEAILDDDAFSDAFTKGSDDWVGALVSNFGVFLGSQQPEVADAILTNLDGAIATVNSEMASQGFRVDFSTITADMTGPEIAQLFHAMGFSWAESIALGFAAADLPGRIGNEGSKAGSGIRDAFAHEIESGSPSRVFMRFGGDVAEGFGLGLSRGLQQLPPGLGLTRNVHPSETPVVNVDVSGVQPHGATSIEIHGQTKDLDASIRLAGTMQGIVRRMETKVGK
jgi:hypothetical protein